MISVAHFSDLHATPVRPDGPKSLLNKRFFGWLSWNVRRKQVYRGEILAALIDDLAETKPDQIVVTGDLTNIGLESEFEAAREWLERIGEPGHVFAIPGNHDTYVPAELEHSFAHWTEYLESDPSADASVAADGEVEYPTVRRRGPVAFVGVCSAHPTSLFKASGTVGPAQLERLEALLTELDDSSVCRVVLIHHPVTDGATWQRRSLSDAAAFRAVLRRAGADLVLHGNCGKDPEKRAQYHLYDIAPAHRDAPGPRFRVNVRARGYDPETRRFAAEGEREL